MGALLQSRWKTQDQHAHAGFDRPRSGTGIHGTRSTSVLHSAPFPMGRAQASRSTAGRLFHIAHMNPPRPRNPAAYCPRGVICFVAGRTQAKRQVQAASGSRERKGHPRIRPVSPVALDFGPRKCEKEARSPARIGSFREQTRNGSPERLASRLEAVLSNQCGPFAGMKSAHWRAARMGSDEPAPIGATGCRQDWRGRCREDRPAAWPEVPPRAFAQMEGSYEAEGKAQRGF